MAQINDSQEQVTINVETLQPVTRTLMTIGALPTSYLISMTYEEQLLWLQNYLIKTVIPAINNNAEATQEVQDIVMALQNYINDYFNNLDVQEEINNKLEQMTQDGTLEQLIFFNNIIYATRPGHNLQPMLFNDTDETQKLQAIIDWALQNNGAKIMLPTGSTKISSININGNGALNIEIIGMGESTKIKSITNSNQKMFNVEASENGQIDYFSIKNLSLLKDENVSTNVTGLYLNKVCNNCSIENLYINGFDTGLETYKCWTLKILNNNFYRNNLFGIKIGSETHNCTIYGNKISYNNDVGIKISSSYEINLENNDIEDNDGYGIVLNNTREMNIFKNYIENNGISNINSFSEIFIEANTIKTNILYNFINCNSALNCIIINPVSNNINISNNTFTGGDETKKIIKCVATATTQIQGNFTNNIYGSFTNPFEFNGSQFIIENYNNNKILKSTNKTIYNELVSSDGSYIIRTGQNGEIKFELNYNSSGEPIISIASGNAGSEVYKKILTLMNDLNLLVRKSISFETKHSNTEIDENNCLFVATNGELRFKDMNGNIHTIVSISQ